MPEKRKSGAPKKKAPRKAAPKNEVPDSAAKEPVDVAPRIAKRAYELYEQRGRQDGRAVQDWEQAEREIRREASPQ